LRISKNKTKYIEYDFGGRYQEVEGMNRLMTMSRDVIGEVENYKYLGLFIQKNGGFYRDVNIGLSAVG
jgi:hypothetical protein